MTYRLTGIANEYSFDLGASSTMVVGRAVNSDCPVVDPTVSRRHAELRVEDTGIQVKDVGSSNGTFVNGVKVESYFVVPGDTVTFGSVMFRVEVTGGDFSNATTETRRADYAPDTPLALHDADATPVVSAAPTPHRPTSPTTIVRHVPTSAESFAAIGKQSGSIQAVMATTLDPAEKDREKLRILLEVSKGLSRSADVDVLLRKVADYAFETLEADRCTISLLDERGQMVSKVSRDRRGTAEGAPVPQSIARTVIEDKVAVLSDDAVEDERFAGQSVLMQQVRSAMCAPLMGAEDRVLGVLYVDNSVTTHRFSEADLDFLIAFAGIAAVAIENGQFSDRIRREALARSNFERFFTPHLAARIANSADAVKLGGDKRPVAVLFSDIRGFTALSETMNPDAMARLLSEYFTEMVECVFRHGGTLDKFIGDAVMAQWGAPLTERDDVDRAMEAALDMMIALDQLNARWARESRPTLQIGIGLNFGEAFAGNIGSERRLEYTVIGSTVNTASRLCSAAGPGEILLSEDFRLALKTPPRLTPLAPMELKGKRQAIPVYHVVR